MVDQSRNPDTDRCDSPLLPQLGNHRADASEGLRRTGRGTGQKNPTDFDPARTVNQPDFDIGAAEVNADIE
jgi:hypothetical protein